RVVVTGATGQVAYALLPRIAAGEMFGPETEVDLRLSDIPQMIDKAKGTLMELEDGAFPLLASVVASADRAETHHRADWVLLVGSVPRGPGMERGDLIRKNGPIFVEEGKAIQRYASSGVRVVVVGNPCNTNCLIAHANPHTVPANASRSMTRHAHDQGRLLQRGDRERWLVRRAEGPGVELPAALERRRRLADRAQRPARRFREGQGRRDRHRARKRARPREGSARGLEAKSSRSANKPTHSHERPHERPVTSCRTPLFVSRSMA